jgi:hypothetical protein
MASHKPKPTESKRTRALVDDDETDVDEATFLFEDDEDEEDFEPEETEDTDFGEDWE